MNRKHLTLEATALIGLALFLPGSVYADEQDG